jgi:D-threo-aldose 1-dehydrogenase
MDPTQVVTLGRSDVEVTRLGLGTAPLGGLYDEVSDTDAHATLLRAYELGLRFVDTAPLYGSGLAETRVGRALPHMHGTTVATKVGRVLEPGAADAAFKGAPPLHARFDFSAPGVLRSFAESLQRLKTDRVDVVHIHDPDDHHGDAIDHAFPALAELRADGRVGAVGAGMNQTAMLTRFAREADFDCFLVAGRYTLLDRSAADDLFPACMQRRIGVICGGVYNSGVLAGGTTYDYGPASRAILARAKELERTCARYGVPLKAAAVQFPLTHPAVTCVVVGARTAAEIEDNVRMFEMDVPAALWYELR